MAEEDFSILKKSVIPNLLQEGFQPTFLTEIEDTNSEDNQDCRISQCQGKEERNHSEEETIKLKDIDVKESRGSFKMLSQDMSDVEERRRSFRSNIDYKKTLGIICVYLFSVFYMKGIFSS